MELILVFVAIYAMSCVFMWLLEAALKFECPLPLGRLDYARIFLPGWNTMCSASALLWLAIAVCCGLRTGIWPSVDV
jgi:hypothetical protein